MGLSIPPQFGQVRWKWFVAGDSDAYLCTLGVQMPNTGDPQVICAALAQAVIDQFPASALGTSYTYKGASLIAGGVGGDDIYEAELTQAGTGGTNSPPSNCALGVRKETGVGGRKNKGRMFWPAGYLLEGNVNDVGIITPATVTALQTAFNGFYTKVTTALGTGLKPVVLHTDPVMPPTVVGSFKVQSRIYSTPHRMK